MDRLFDTFIREPFSTVEGLFARTGRWSPNVDLAESESEVTVCVELPGLDPKDIDVTITGKQLTISGAKTEVSEQQGKDFYHTESRSGCFRRTIPMPSSIDRDKVEAEFKNGILVVRLEKSEGGPHETIEVKSKDEPATEEELDREE
jgi:HSP20 family protein